MSVVTSSPEPCKSFAYVLGVYLGDGAVTLWRMAGKTDRLIFRLNTIDQDFAEATRAALADLSDYKVSLSRHPVPKSANPNWALALGDRALCERLIADTNRKSIIPPYVFDWSRELKLPSLSGSWTARAS